MITLADVILWGTRVGVIAWDDKRQVGNFEYTKKFAETGFEIAPITCPCVREPFIASPHSGTTRF